MSGGDDVDGKQPAVGDGALAGEEQQHRRRKRRQRRHRRRRWRMVMPLYLVRGSFFVTDDAAAARGAGMDAEVWSKVPDDLMWEVLLFLPAAKLWQLQSVSRNWRQELTSAHFQKRLRKCHGEQQQQQQQERVVACVQLRPQPCKRSKSGDSSGTRNSDNSDVNDKVLEVDLSFVPRSFWSKLGHSYSVKAAAHGLVCICNDSEDHHWNAWATNAQDGERYEGGGPGRPRSNRHCVLNPLTRTRIVLPEPPFVPDRWLLPTSTSVAILSCSYPGGWGRDDVTVPETVLFATYNLQLASATAGAGWVLLHKLVFPRGLGGCYCNWPPDGAVLDDQAYWYNRDDNTVHLMPADGVQAAGGAQVLDGPSVTLLGLYASSRNSSLLFGGNYFERSALVAHRGAIYFVADLLKHGERDVVCGLWRLAHSDVDGRMEWEGVARLERAEVARLLAAGSRSGGLERARGGFELGHRVELEAYGVREFVCCHLFDVQDQWGQYGERRLLGFNLDTHKWELVYSKSQAPMENTAFELRPDHPFLSS